MRTHERIAIAAVVAGLRKSGAINDDAVAAVAAELENAARQMADYGGGEHNQMVKLAADVAAGKVTSRMF